MPTSVRKFLKFPIPGPNKFFIPERFIRLLNASSLPETRSPGARRHECWEVAEIDALVSLATASSGDHMCRPKFLDGGDKAVLDLRGCRHPVAAAAMGDAFMPNDTALNTPEVPAGTLLVTGPNMGGKSTVLRQTCIAVVMAQVGCFVNADRAVLTPVDKIFTRVGANDSLVEGKSTFLIELEETQAMLQSATSRSALRSFDLDKRVVA